MTSKKKRLIIKCFIIVLTYSIIELFCLFMIRSGYIPAREPNFHFVWNPKYPLPMADINPVWGAWHYKEPFRGQYGCINYDYAINSYGARDKERNKLSSDTNRVVVLGDSFLEGYGIKAADRLSDILEKKTSHEFLNFSCTSFSNTQEYLIYKHLADSFNHSTILIGFQPLTDFDDDDFNFPLQKKRYKPFFIKKDSGYHLTYYQDSLEKSEYNKESYLSSTNSFSQTVKRFFRSYTYWFNIIDYFKNRKNLLKIYKGISTSSYYYNYKPEQIERLTYILTQLRSAAPGKKIILVSIPAVPDIDRKISDGIPPLTFELSKVCSKLQIKYIDLLQAFSEEKDYHKYYFHCDPHWNEKGNKYAADILSMYFLF